VSGNCLSSLPVSINAFGLIGGIHPIEPLDASIGFIRSRSGAITSFAYFPTMHGLPTILTGLNASGAAVGYYSATDFTPDATGDLTSFLLHPDGYLDQFSVPVDDPYFSESTAAESINDAGAIAGTYSICFYECASITTGGFVRSPEVEFTFFNAPGPIVREPGSPSVFFRSRTTTVGATPAQYEQRRDDHGILHRRRWQPTRFCAQPVWDHYLL
jgi:hypothetical protein